MTDYVLHCIVVSALVWAAYDKIHEFGTNPNQQPEADWQVGPITTKKNGWII